MRALVENVSVPGRPAVGRPNRRAGTQVVEDRLDELVGTGGAGRLQTLLAELDVIRGQLPARAAELVKARLAELLGTSTGTSPASSRLAARLRGEPFFEAYFSNYIEGTEFGVEEARRIALDGEVPLARPADAHDVSATYRLVVDPELARAMIRTC